MPTVSSASNQEQLHQNHISKSYTDSQSPPCCGIWTPRDGKVRVAMLATGHGASVYRVAAVTSDHGTRLGDLGPIWRAISLAQGSVFIGSWIAPQGCIPNKGTPIQPLSGLAVALYPPKGLFKRSPQSPPNPGVQLQGILYYTTLNNIVNYVIVYVIFLYSILRNIYYNPEPWDPWSPAVIQGFTAQTLQILWVNGTQR